MAVELITRRAALDERTAIGHGLDTGWPGRPRIAPAVIVPVACAESRRGLPLFRSFAGGKGGSLAGRVFEGTSPPLCGVRTRKSETRRAKSPLNSQAYSGRPGERCSCYGEYKPV
jgi:hypothetical protein